MRRVKENTIEVDKVDRIEFVDGISYYSVCAGDIKYIALDFDCDIKLNTIGHKEGQLVCRAFNYASKKQLPIVSFVSSGGIRVTEGTIALMEMMKMVLAVQQHHNKGLLYVSVIKNVTLGGASASFVALADILIGVQGAVYGFTGKRIIQNTTKEKIREDFQTVEYAKKHGMIDIVVQKEEVREIILKILRLHRK